MNPFLEKNDNYINLMSLLLDSIPNIDSPSHSAILGGGGVGGGGGSSSSGSSGGMMVGLNKNKYDGCSPVRRYSKLMEQSDEKIDSNNNSNYTSINHQQQQHHHHDNDYNNNHHNNHSHLSHGVLFETPGVIYQYPTQDSVIQDTNPISRNKVSHLDHQEHVPVTELFPTPVHETEADRNPLRINRQQQQQQSGQQQQQQQQSGQQQQLQQQQIHSHRNKTATTSATTINTNIKYNSTHVITSTSSVTPSIDSKYDGSTISSSMQELDSDQNRAGRCSRKLQSSLSMVVDDDDHDDDDDNNNNHDDDGDYVNYDDAYVNDDEDNENNHGNTKDHHSMTPQVNHINHHHTYHHHTHTSKHHRNRRYNDEVIDRPSKWTRIEFNYYYLTPIISTFITSYFINNNNNNIESAVDLSIDKRESISKYNNKDELNNCDEVHDEDIDEDHIKSKLMHEDAVTVSLNGVVMLGLVGVCFLSYFHKSYIRG